jgi:hypothetical protein
MGGLYNHRKVFLSEKVSRCARREKKKKVSRRVLSEKKKSSRCARCEKKKSSRRARREKRK